MEFALQFLFLLLLPLLQHNCCHLLPEQMSRSLRHLMFLRHCQCHHSYDHRLEERLVLGDRKNWSLSRNHSFSDFCYCQWVWVKICRKFVLLVLFCQYPVSNFHDSISCFVASVTIFFYIFTGFFCRKFLFYGLKISCQLQYQFVVILCG